MGLVALLPPVEQAVLRGQSVEQVGARAVVGGGPPHGALQLQRRLPVGAGGGGPHGGLGSVPQNRFGVAGTVGVVGEHCVVGVALGEAGRQRTPVEIGQSVRRRGVEDGTSGQLMAEPELAPVADEESGADQGIHVGGVGVARPRVEQVRIEPAADDGRRLQRRASAVAERGHPREHRVPDRDRQRVAVRAEHLGHEVGIATGQGVDGRGVEAAARRHARDGRAGERGEVESTGGSLGGERPETDAQRVGWARAARRGTSRGPVRAGDEAVGRGSAPGRGSPRPPSAGPRGPPRSPGWGRPVPGAGRRRAPCGVVRRGRRQRRSRPAARPPRRADRAATG